MVLISLMIRNWTESYLDYIFWMNYGLLETASELYIVALLRHLGLGLVTVVWVLVSCLCYSRLPRRRVRHLLMATSRVWVVSATELWAEACIPSAATFAGTFRALARRVTRANSSLLTLSPSTRRHPILTCGMHMVITGDRGCSAAFVESCEWVGS